MARENKYYTQFRRGVIEVQTNRDGVVETKDNCTLSMRTSDLRRDAIAMTVMGVVMILFATVTVVPFLQSAIQDKMNVYAILVMTGFWILWCGFLVRYIRSRWRFIDEPHLPITITRKTITLTNNTELLWADIEVIYFTISYYRYTESLYILTHDNGRIKIKDWSLYASEEQWRRVLARYSGRQIVEKKRRRF